MIEQRFVKVRMAKSMLENEEGMNHLLIQIEPLSGVTQAEVQLLLPKGIYWESCAGVMIEEAKAVIRLEQPWLANELLLGICTTEPVSCGKAVIEINMSFKDSCGNEHDHKLSVPLEIVDAEEIDDAQFAIDKEVVRKVKERDAKLGGRPLEKVNDNGILDCTPAKVVRYNPYYRSVLEELYRVEGTGTLER